MRVEKLFLYNYATFTRLMYARLRGWPGAEGWEGRPHPDNKKHEKFDLCKRGILQAWRSLAPKMTKCYIWLDFGCMNQDADPAGELKQLHDIVGSSDCLFTPIVQSDFNWRFNPCYENIYLEYMAEAWNTGPHAYLNRGWTRVEMLYASTIPLSHVRNGERIEKFAEGMKFQYGLGRRPHLLYGTRELKKSLPVIIIPPLSNSYFDEFHPEKGHVSYEQDLIKIRSLVNWIQPLVTKGNSGYDGEYNELNRKHGLGTEIYPNGNIYTGSFQNNKRHGLGKLQRSDGGWYEGDWQDDEMSGSGTFHVASGDIYVGEFKKGVICGVGKLTIHLGITIEGYFEDSLPKRATFRAIDGTVLFDGECTDDGFPKVNCFYGLKFVSLFFCCLVPCGFVRIARSSDEVKLAKIVVPILK